MKTLVGFKNETWEVLSFVGQDSRTKRLWLVRCFCGKEVVRKTEEIKSGRAKSCGCYKQTRPGNKYKHEATTLHGFSRAGKKHPIYVNWLGIKQRCYNPNHVSYKYYGGKGIVMCEEWKNNPVAFIDWCLNNGWKEHMTLDRIDSNKNYSPENCEIITQSENSKRYWKSKINN